MSPMHDLYTIEQATGATMEAGREYERIQHEDAWTGAYCDGTPVRLLPQALADAMRDELLAIILRLVGERDGTLPGDVEDDVRVVWDDFWHDIVCPDGRLSVAQVARELSDYSVVMREVSLVYDDITMGTFSKPNTAHGYVIDRVNELERGHIEEAVKEVRAERDRYRDTLLSRHGGEPLALLDELDEARREVEYWQGLAIGAAEDAERQYEFSIGLIAALKQKDVELGLAKAGKPKQVLPDEAGKDAQYWRVADCDIAKERDALRAEIERLTVDKPADREKS